MTNIRNSTPKSHSTQLPYPDPHPYNYTHILLIHRTRPALDLYNVTRELVAEMRSRGWLVVGSGAK